MIADLVEKLYAHRPENTLYHYTSLKGVMGIVESGSLRATEIHFLNDEAEMNHTANFFQRAILQREKEGRSINSRLLVQLREWISHRFSLLGHMLFVACFTSNGNLLSQWRSYSPMAKGVSLGFLPEKICESANQQSYLIGQCIYDVEKQKTMVSNLLDAIENLAKEKGENTNPSKRHPSNSFHDIFEEIEGHLLRVAALLKHPSFLEEQEWRVVSPVTTNYVETPIKYREGPSMLIPFMNFRLPKASDRLIDIEHVFLGPTPNLSNSMTSLSNYLAKNGVSPRQGLASCQIPYRTW